MTIDRVFVGRLSGDTTEATLRDYFSKFGEVNDCFIVPDNITGCSKGYGFVSFIDSAMAEQALAQQDHVILGRKVDVKPATPRGQRKQEQGTNPHQQQKNEVKKIFVGGLPDGLSTTQFRTYFKSYGPVKDVVMMHDPNNRPRGFGFITFQSEDGAGNALRQRFHELNNKRVEVKMAEPKERMVQTYNSYHGGFVRQSFGPYGQGTSPYGYGPVPYWDAPYFYPYGYGSAPLPWYTPYSYTPSE